MSCGCKQKNQEPVVQQPPTEPLNITVQVVNVDVPLSELASQTGTTVTDTTNP
jgi:hypothetical protein